MTRAARLVLVALALTAPLSWALALAVLAGVAGAVLR